MFRYSISRILQTFFVLIGVSIILFLLLYVYIPGDVARLTLGPKSDAQTIEAFRHELGLDKPLYQQYSIYMANLAKGDLGMSYRFKEPVSELLFEALPKTFQLAFWVVIVELFLALITVIVSYLSKRPWLDTFVIIATVFFISLPTFWLAMLMQYWLGVKWRFLPVSGSEGVASFIMPVTALALVSTAVIVRILRASLDETANKEYVLLARAKGLSERQVLLKHQLKNAFVPTLTYIGIDFGALMTGAVATEIVFNWPGVGLLMYQAVLQRDIPVILSGVLVLVAIYVLVNLVVDLLYGFFNPLVREQ